MEFRSKPASRLAVAALMLAISTPMALAQSLRSDAVLAPSEIARLVEADGYQLTGPVLRRGSVYLVDVLGEGDVAARIVVRARDGRLLRRMPLAPNARLLAAAPRDASPLTEFLDGLFGRLDDAPLSPPPASDFGEPHKPNVQFRRPRPATAPLAQRAKETKDGAGAVAPAASPPAVTAVAPSPSPAAPSPGSGAPKLNDLPVAPLE
jgi:hypothetical protein